MCSSRRTGPSSPVPAGITTQFVPLTRVPSLFVARELTPTTQKLWNARDGKFLKSLRGHVAPVGHSAAPHNRILPPRTALLLTPELQVYQCSWSADSRLLVTGSKDCTLKVWNARSGSLAMDLPGHEDEVCMQSARECTALLSRAERLLTQEIARSTPWTGPPTGRWSVRAGRTRLCGRGGTEVVCPWRWYYGEERKPMIPCPCRAARKGADLMLNSAQLLISLVCVGASTSCVGRWSAELVAGYRCAAA